MSEKQITWVAIPPEVQAFAVDNRVDGYLLAVLELAQRCFPGAKVSVVLEEDHEVEGLRYLVVMARGARLSVEEAVAATDEYHRGLIARVPAPLIGSFRLGMELAR